MVEHSILGNVHIKCYQCPLGIPAVTTLGTNPLPSTRNLNFLRNVLLSIGPNQEIAGEIGIWFCPGFKWNQFKCQMHPCFAKWNSSNVWWKIQRCHWDFTTKTGNKTNHWEMGFSSDGVTSYRYQITPSIRPSQTDQPVPRFKINDWVKVI